MLEAGKYRVDLDTGFIYGRAGKKLQPWVGSDEGHLFIGLYNGGQRRAIAVARLVWLAATMQPIPPKFEMHHRDLNVEHNSFSNIVCLHYLDHKKIHHDEGLIVSDFDF